MKIKQYEIWIADLNPRFGTEAGKTKPVAVIQSDLLNKFHPSTIVCPITTNVKVDANILRVHLTKGSSKLKEDCDIMIDQVRAIDNKRLLKKIGDLNQEQIELIKTNLSIVLDF
ncbi:MAG: type II toxin-antitoxin system PemK/MazF family toxin [Chitinophagales bacterium]|nr:type II toxin-antitoxin system PemK/MazF family toxin [Chitinophagaceae bacterium]MBP9882400.1 type II toxin-antitoxin system PemK/MazF family toxin [Chitinophagales bacterium]